MTIFSMSLWRISEGTLPQLSAVMKKTPIKENMSPLVPNKLSKSKEFVSFWLVKSPTLKKTADVVIAGGGLSGAVLALRFKTQRPRKSILLFESSPLNHWMGCWPYLDVDGHAARHDWLVKTSAHRWESFWVHFPEMSREISIGVSLLERRRLASLLQDQLKDDLILQAPVASLSVDSAVLTDGRRIESPLVFDARNKASTRPSPTSHYKHVVGLSLDLKGPHGQLVPVLMDARCPQSNGFQYFSTYPVGPQELYIEGVMHSDSPSFDSIFLRGQVLKFLAYRGWDIQQVKGAWWNTIPLPMKIPASRIMQLSAMDPAPIGLEAQIYNYATGYSLPYLCDLSHQIAISGRWSSGLAKAILKKFESQFILTQDFNLVVNRILFKKGDPADQYLFYRNLFELDLETVRGFLSSQLRKTQRLSLLSRQRHVPLHRLVSAPFLNA